MRNVKLGKWFLISVKSTVSRVLSAFFFFSLFAATVAQAQDLYTFESGTQGWTFNSGGPIDGVSRSTDRSYDGTHSLAISLNTSTDTGFVYINSVTVPGGTVLTMHLWVPPSFTGAGAETYVMDANYTWTDGDWSSLTPGAWNTLTVTVPSNAANPLFQIGVLTVSALSAPTTVYLDAVTSDGDTQAPTTPTNLAVTAASSNQTNLTWTAATDNIGVTGYRLERCSGSGCSDFTQVATPTTTSYSDTGLAASTSYSYRVRAVDAAGNLSSYSTTASATTPNLYTFESGAQGWTFNSGGPVTGISQSTDQSYDGAHSLAISLNTSTDTGFFYVNSVTVPGGTVLTMHLWVPATFTGVGAEAYVMDANYTWTDGDWNSLTPGAWNTLTVTVPSNAANPLFQIGVLTLSTLSSPATLYLDAVTSGADAQAPTAPTNLAVTAASSNQTNLTWTAAIDNIGVTGYRVERCTGSGCSSFTQIATPTTTSYSDTGLAASASYSYRVRATDAAGNLSNYSTTASVTTPSAGDVQAPTIPAGLFATAISTTQIDLGWSASTDNVGVTAYLLERCQNASCTTFTQIASPAGTSYSDTNLNPSTSYSYRVRATDAATNASGYSNTVSATTHPLVDTQAPTAPTGIAAAGISTTQISVSWNVSSDNVGVTAYLLERCQGSGCSNFSQIASVTGSSYTDSGLTPATIYVYRVRARDAANNISDYSSIASAAPQYTGPITYTYSYDALGRISHAAGSDGSSIDYHYDANGNVTLINRQ